jgi:hypothetical protein
VDFFLLVDEELFEEVVVARGMEGVLMPLDLEEMKRGDHPDEIFFPPLCPFSMDFLGIALVGKISLTVKG